MRQTTSLNAACEKPLPPKPTLRPQESPERRSVFDAQDLTANSLNGRYPPLEPASSPDAARSDQQSPAPSSFFIAPSLLSRNQSPNSVSTSEYGVATSTTIQSVVNRHVGVEREHAYTLNAPGTSKIPRLGSRLQNSQPTYGSPSRPSGSEDKINRSMLRGRQALSVRGRQPLFIASARRGNQGSIQQEDAHDNLPVTSTSGGFNQRSNLKSPLEESATDVGTERTSSKYGFKIRESIDAREAIMGQAGYLVKPPTRTPPHPPRTSSLPKTPPPCAIGSASNSKSLPTSRPSIPNRQTAASFARAAFNAKKISESRASTSRIPQSRTLASFGDVGKGMKNFGKKVGKIIPYRRSSAVEAISDELVTATSEQSHEPRRQASRLLTTFKNSGMEDSSEDVIRRSVNNGDGSMQPEPGDRHEPDGADKEKEIWYAGSRNRAHDAETDRYVRFGQQDADSGDDEEDERPPSRRGIRVILDGHYVEDGVEDDDENARDAELPPTRRGSFESNATAVAVETNVAPAVVDSNLAAHTLIPDPQFDQMLTQTDIRARQLLSYATGLDESPMRSLMIETATHLAEGVMHTRQARIDLVRSSQALDEATVILAANTHRMSVILQRISALSPTNLSA
jgi:hypothetical protein